MDLSSLKPARGAIKKRKRIGRGIGSGHGKTATRGTKGQKSRSGWSVRPGFEGGQMPLMRRIPKRGFRNPFRIEYQILNLRSLQKFPPNAEVNPQVLKEEGLIKGKKPVKILGEGEISNPLTVLAHSFSRSAREKIEAKGGKVQTIKNAKIIRLGGQN
ncbi:50S ribosomal protein L15 [candidate division TA06 bacterium]|nr:50S ribosomal protein L15 [candidate division TA06 bacterium]